MVIFTVRRSAFCLQRQLLEQLVSMGASDNAADELAQLLEACVGDVSQLGCVCGDLRLVNAALHQLQVFRFV